MAETDAGAGLPAPEPPPSRPFVGREPELREIGRALDEALAGRGRLVLLAGEPGIGKTRLADEAAARAARRGARVLWGRCWESGGAPAYWPWLDALGELARRLDDRALAEALAEGAGLVAELVPEIRARLAPAAAVAPPSAAEARFRLWRAVTGLVRRVAAAEGLFLVLDDLHAADESSLLLLHFLARELRAMRVLVLGTYRDVEARLQPGAGELVARIGREGATIGLRRLDRDATATFLRERAGGVARAVEERIFASTQGNPLFLEEMARLLGDEGATAIEAGALPHGVREVIRQRLDRVPATARPLLDLAAVAGDEVDVALVTAAAERAGLEVHAVGTTLVAAVRAGVLADRGGGRLRFFHALVREVLYRELDPTRRRALHGAVAAALERLQGGGPAPRFAELAHHALEALAGEGAAPGRTPAADAAASPPPALERAVDFTVRAAERALAQLAYEEAIALLARAAAAVEAFGSPPGTCARVLVALGDARIRHGEGGRGRADCLEAAACARRIGSAELLAQAALAYGQVFTFAVVDPMLVSLLEEALAALPPGDSALRVRVLARLGAALQPAPRSEEPVRVAREGIAAARRLGDERTLLGALYAGLSALMDVVDPRERLALNLEVERLAHALGDREKVLRTHARLVVDHMELGEIAAADARIDAFEALAEELRAPWEGWRAPLFRSMRAIFAGRFAEAESLCARALSLGLAAHDHQVVRCCALHREGLLRAWEQHDGMLAFDPEARRAIAGMWQAPAWQAMNTARMFTRREDADSARLHLELMPPDLRPPIDNVFSCSPLAETVAFVGDLDQCARAYELLRPAAERDVMLGLTCVLWEGPVARLLGLLAFRMGRTDEGRARLDEAIARAARLGAAPCLARARYELGRALARAGDPRDADRARALLGQAGELAGKLDMSGLAALAERRLAALGAGPAVDLPAGAASDALAAAGEAPIAPAAAPAPGGAATFSLAPEGEYWSVSFEGQTFRLKDSLGLRYLARLVAEPDRELHALDLAGGRAATEDAPVDAGDAGELLDAEAREAYRRRLEELREMAAEAEDMADVGRAARAREEIERLGAELGRAVGLGGRSRRAGGAAERARSAVQRRIKNALERIQEHAPGLAAYLGRTIKTGTFCVYRPRDGS